LEDKPAICPNCSIEMQFVSAVTATGRGLILDQCKRCGGIWFDRWELYALDLKKVDDIDNFDLEKLQEPLEINPVQKCPRCNMELRLFKDPALSRDILIFRCHNCSGLWLNCGELKKYKKHREESAKRKELTDKKIEQMVNIIMKKEMESPGMQFFRWLLKLLTKRVNPHQPWYM